MRLAGMNQLAVSVKESLKTLTTDNHTEAKERPSSIQKTYVDSVELSDRAIKLSMGVDTEKGSNGESGTSFKEMSVKDKEQNEEPGTNQQKEPAYASAVSLNALA